MGIENKTIEKYGLDYWQKNKNKILKAADKNGNLQRRRVALNARERRSLDRRELQEEWKRLHPRFGKPKLSGTERRKLKKERRKEKN